jgi:hypothetical protein
MPRVGFEPTIPMFEQTKTVHALGREGCSDIYQSPKGKVLGTYGAVDVENHVFLTSALVAGEWSASHPGRFTPGERASATHWVGGQVGPRAGVNDKERREIQPLPGLEL